MSRRSSRLVSGGYYNSDEESDSSSVTNISYRENPVKVFKKKAGTRKAGSRTGSRANSNASSPGPESPTTADQYDGLGPSPLSRPTQPTMRTVPYIATTATPRPPLTTSSSRSVTPVRCPSVTSEKSPYSGLCSSSRSGLHLRPGHKELSQSSVDSSGYSSSEGPLRKLTTTPTSDPSRISSNGGSPTAGYRSRINSAFSSLMESVTVMAVVSQSKIMHLAALANTSVSSRMKKACGLFLLLLLILLCIWFLLPLLTSLFSRMAVTKTLSQTKPNNQPVFRATPPPEPNTIHPTHVVDPAIVSAAVEARIQRLLDPAVVSAAVEAKMQRLLDPAIVSAAVEAKMQRLLDPAVVSAAVEGKMQRLLDPAVVSAAVEAKMQRLLDPAVVSAAVEAKMQHLLDPAVVSAAVEAKMQHLLDPAVVSATVEAKMQHLLDPAVVSAVVEEQMHHLLEEQQLKQEHILSQIKNSLQLDMQDLKAKLEVVDSDSQLRLEQEVAGLGRQMDDHQTDRLSATDSLSLRMQALEAQNAKLSQEWSSIQMMPPPAPCPDTSTAPVQNHLTPELQQAMEKWFTDRIKGQDAIRLGDKVGCSDCGRPIADKMPDFALETQGASVISTRCSETYRIRSACVTLFGFPLWYPSESPRTVIQGYPVLLPGKCWAFHGVQGTLVISLSHPITLTHVTLDHLPRYNSPTGRIDSAPKDFEVYGMKNDTEEGTLLGTFTYDENGEPTQTFRLPNPSDVVYRFVELRVLTNWGHVEYTCLYRFRVHGQIAST
ncbi:uncharacterized protein LOC131971449 isoform X2 [Centropristis striata]|uniref:uncharacterized protein LOC131971449 isoform X2 n=1 Tax=Centropristis striata TaxID=184440 RepID=UPI0027E0D589|nr:uncharacterized protein LOC131971449 isoform X2 [Centropristis striata]